MLLTTEKILWARTGKNAGDVVSSIYQYPYAMICCILSILSRVICLSPVVLGWNEPIKENMFTNSLHLRFCWSCVGLKRFSQFPICIALGSDFLDVLTSFPKNGKNLPGKPKHMALSEYRVPLNPLVHHCESYWSYWNCHLGWYTLISDKAVPNHPKHISKAGSCSSLPAGMSMKESRISLPETVWSFVMVTLPTWPCMSRMSWIGMLADLANSMAISTCRTCRSSSKLVMSPRSSSVNLTWATHLAGPDIAPSVVSQIASSPYILQLPSLG